MTLSIGVIGGGVLGRAVARGFMEHGEVRVFDMIPERSSHTEEEAAQADIVFICLPTPSLPSGRCNTSAIEECLNRARANEWWKQESCYVIRSTVPVGFTQRIYDQYLQSAPLLHSPEFLTARCSLVDFQTPARNIVGTPKSVSVQSRERIVVAVDKVLDLYQRRFVGVQLHHLKSDESELVKLACNAFFATKVTYFNLIRQVADKVGADWPSVLGAILSDGRIAHAHTAVPGPDGRLGFGGTCLPKDTASLGTTASDLEIPMATLLVAVLGCNQMIRTDGDIRHNGLAGPE